MNRVSKFVSSLLIPLALLSPRTASAEATVTLKDAYQPHFKIGTAINRSVATGKGWRRSDEQVKGDIALVQTQFNQVVAEKEMKWMSLHPRAGKDGYDWTAADAFVEFGTKHNMELAGHTLVWHSQTPNWVFEGTFLKKIPVMAIGTQAHLNVSISVEAMDQSLAEMKALGLPIHVTELDVNGALGGQGGSGADVAGNAAATDGGLVAEADKKLTGAYTGIFKAFLKHKDAVKLVTFWGPNDANSWRSRGRPLLFDADGKPKPAFDAVIKLATEDAPKAP